MAWPRQQATRAALGGYPAYAISALASSRGLAGVAWALASGLSLAEADVLASLARSPDGR